MFILTLNKKWFSILQKKLNEEKSLRKAVLESKLERQANEAEFAPKKIQATLSTRSGKPPTVIITPDNIEYVNR